MEIVTVLKYATPFLVNFTGWAQKALKDDKVEKYEVKELVASLMRQGAVTFVGAGVFAGVGIDIDLATAVMAGGLVELTYMYLGKLFKKLQPKPQGTA